ncbi:MAG: MCP four helix bundle domain-containing protein, partial [Planctomycetaceae bacterium]|nr:MCP four helix bundle domain-containing protein [Planctomycetaceae bacterium]
MLNKFKIGKKLIGGFTFVLFLLLFVALCGYWGLQQNTDATNEVINVVGIQSQIVEIRNAMFQAQLNALNGVLTRNKKIGEERKKIDHHLRKLADSVKPSLMPEDQEILQKLIVAYNEFAALDDRWYAVEDERIKEVTFLKERAVFITDSLNSLANIVEKTMKTPEEAKEIEHEYYFSEKQSVQLKKINHSSTTFARLRRYFYQYLSELDPKNQEKIVADINKDIQDLRDELDTIKTNLTTDADKIFHTQIIEALMVWENSFKKSIAHLVKQQEYDAEQAQKIAAMETFRDEITTHLSNEVQRIQKISKETSWLMSAVILTASVFALIVGVIASFSLSRNITTGLTKVMITLKKVILEGDLSAEISNDLLNRRDEVGEMAN